MILVPIRSAVLVLVSGVAGLVSAAEVVLSVRGTTEPFAMREITVGPQIFDCLFCEMVSVVDVNQTEGVSNEVVLPREGGVVNAFLFVEVSEPSAGLKSMVVDLWTHSNEITLSEPIFDIAYLDVPGRTATFAGMPAGIPEERAISGPLSTAEDGQFQQAWTHVFGGVTGLADEHDYRDISAGSSSLVTSPDTHTYGIGQTGNDQSGGRTAVLRFTITVPPLDSEELSRIYAVRGRIRSLLTFVDRPMYGRTVPPASAIIEAVDALDTISRQLVIKVGNVPAGSGDCDSDGDVDLVDLGTLRLCFSGAGHAAFRGCSCQDFDGDLDVDLVDFAQFQVHFTGPGGGVATDIPLPDPTTAKVKGDVDSDGDHDYVDMAWFELCHAGPGGGLVMPGCDNMDYDDDGDVDLVDFGFFKLDYSGPMIPRE